MKKKKAPVKKLTPAEFIGQKKREEFLKRFRPLTHLKDKKA